MCTPRVVDIKFVGCVGQRPGTQREIRQLSRLFWYTPCTFSPCTQQRRAMHAAEACVFFKLYTGWYEKVCALRLPLHFRFLSFSRKRSASSSDIVPKSAIILNILAQTRSKAVQEVRQKGRRETRGGWAHATSPINNQR